MILSEQPAHILNGARHEKSHLTGCRRRSFTRRTYRNNLSCLLIANLEIITFTRLATSHIIGTRHLSPVPSLIRAVCSANFHFLRQTETEETYPKNQFSRNYVSMKNRRRHLHIRLVKKKKKTWWNAPQMHNASIYRNPVVIKVINLGPVVHATCISSVIHNRRVIFPAYTFSSRSPLQRRAAGYLSSKIIIVRSSNTHTVAGARTTKKFYAFYAKFNVKTELLI